MYPSTDHSNLAICHSCMWSFEQALQWVNWLKRRNREGPPSSLLISFLPSCSFFSLHFPTAEPVPRLSCKQLSRQVSVVFNTLHVIFVEVTFYFQNGVQFPGKNMNRQKLCVNGKFAVRMPDSILWTSSVLGGASNVLVLIKRLSGGLFHS